MYNSCKNFSVETPMLKEYYQDDRIQRLDLNCAETVLHIANDIYRMGLSPATMKMASGFGGGMGIEDKCGAVTASVMVLGYLFVDRKARESQLIREITREFLKGFESRMMSLDCVELK